MIGAELVHGVTSRHLNRCDSMTKLSSYPALRGASPFGNPLPIASPAMSGFLPGRASGANRRKGGIGSFDDLTTMVKAEIDTPV